MKETVTACCNSHCDEIGRLQHSPSLILGVVENTDKIVQRKAN